MSDKPVHVVFRADGSPEIGMGHIARSLAFAGALREAGSEVTFAVRALAGRAPALIRERGFACEIVAAGVNEPQLDRNDASTTLEIARRAAAELVVVDHYGAGPAYLALLRGAMSVGVVDDFGGRDLGGVDWILNGSIGAGPHLYAGLDAARTRVLAGPQFALLRPAFAARRATLARMFGEGDAKVLVTFGGGDTAALVSEVVHACARVARPLQLRCVLAGDDPSNQIEVAIAASPHDVRLERNSSDIENAMAWADVAVNAGGTTVWELACLGVPMIVLTLAENQRYNARTLTDTGCALALGEPGAALAALPAALEGLLRDAARRRRMSEIASALVDGLGAKRAATQVLGVSSAA